MTNDNRPRRLSRRQRRVVLTAVLLLGGFAIGAVVLVRAYRQNQPTQYRPGEANADITASLARGLPPDAARPVFADVTAEAGLAGFVTFAGRRTSQLPEDMGPGVAWGDYDNDGDDDVFLVSAGGPLGVPPEQLAPSALFENRGGGRFQRVAEFPEPRIIGMAAAWGDYDGDGWIDLAVSGYNALLLFRNDGGRFSLDRRFPSRAGFWSGLAWGDYDNDRRLDLYVCGYVQYVESRTQSAVTQQYGKSVPFTLNPASYEPQPNLLFRNTGRGTFVETAARLGVANPEGRSLSALWHDFDDDGWLDLYVANDISDNVLYRNVKGRFSDVSHPAWVADYRGAMGLASGDWNRDGDDDLFITHWIAQENALYDSHVRDSGALRFADAADTVGLGQVALPMVGWGTEFLDFDSDGWLDLVVANGSTFETEAAPKALVPQRPFLFWNRRGEHFYDVAPLAAPLSTPHVARGLAVSDFDGDGDLDVLIARNGGGVQLLRNDTSAGQWLQIVLRSRASADAPSLVARGAAAVAQAGSAQFRRSVTSASYLSQSTSTLHFGLGAATQVDKVTVRWRGGVVTEHGPLAAGRRWEITEGEPIPREIARATSTATTTAVAGSATERDRIVAFWDRHRAAMHALKVENNPAKAVGLFEQALAIDPTHEDARFYLATALATQGDTDGALKHYEEMNRLNARSHRSLTGWGRLRALTSRGPADLAAAEDALNRAHDLNPEETGALLMLGEIALMRGQRAAAERRLQAVAQANARAAGAFFLLGYIRWKAGDAEHAREYLEKTRTALGPEWKPAGTTAEGDVAVAVAHAATLLSRFWDQWDGVARTPSSYTGLDAYLRRTARPGPQ